MSIQKLEKIKVLADAMYHAAQYLTTDASRLHKAMNEYHQFIITECRKEEPASDDLDKASERAAVEAFFCITTMDSSRKRTIQGWC